MELYIIIDFEEELAEVRFPLYGIVTGESDKKKELIDALLKDNSLAFTVIGWKDSIFVEKLFNFWKLIPKSVLFPDVELDVNIRKKLVMGYVKEHLLESTIEKEKQSFGLKFNKFSDAAYEEEVKNEKENS